MSEPFDELLSQWSTQLVGDDSWKSARELVKMTGRTHSQMGYLVREAVLAGVLESGWRRGKAITGRNCQVPVYRPVNKNEGKKKGGGKK